MTRKEHAGQSTVSSRVMKNLCVATVQKVKNKCAESLLVHWLYLYYSTSFTNSSVMQGCHTQLDNVCIARLGLYSKRTRISTNTRTIFTFCIPKLQTSDNIYIIKHGNENLKLIMYIVANVLNSFTGERSVCEVLVQKGHLCSWVLLQCTGWRRET